MVTVVTDDEGNSVESRGWLRLGGGREYIPVNTNVVRVDVLGPSRGVESQELN